LGYALWPQVLIKIANCDKTAVFQMDTAVLLLY